MAAIAQPRVLHLSLILGGDVVGRAGGKLGRLSLALLVVTVLGL